MLRGIKAVYNNRQWRYPRMQEKLSAVKIADKPPITEYQANLDTDN